MLHRSFIVRKHSFWIRLSISSSHVTQRLNDLLKLLFEPVSLFKRNTVSLQPEFDCLFAVNELGPQGWA